LGYFSGIGFFIRVSTAHIAVTQATWGPRASAVGAVNAWMCAS
jgi:hypothetical protein